MGVDTMSCRVSILCDNNNNNAISLFRIAQLNSVTIKELLPWTSFQWGHQYSVTPVISVTFHLSTHQQLTTLLLTFKTLVTSMSSGLFCYWPVVYGRPSLTMSQTRCPDTWHGGLTPNIRHVCKYRGLRQPVGQQNIGCRNLQAYIQFNSILLVVHTQRCIPIHIHT